MYNYVMLCNLFSGYTYQQYPLGSPNPTNIETLTPSQAESRVRAVLIDVLENRKTIAGLGSFVDVAFPEVTNGSITILAHTEVTFVQVPNPVSPPNDTDENRVFMILYGLKSTGFEIEGYGRFVEWNKRQWHETFDPARHNLLSFVPDRSPYRYNTGDPQDRFRAPERVIKPDYSEEYRLFTSDSLIPEFWIKPQQPNLPIPCDWTPPSSEDYDSAILSHVIHL